MTLEELQLNDEELIAEKNFNVKLREEPLLNYDRELTPKAKICFT